MPTIKKTFLATLLMLLLTACGGSLQSGRLDDAEVHIIQAERALEASNASVASTNLGTAKAYLATVADFRKSLNIHEERRYKDLKQREARIERIIRTMP